MRENDEQAEIQKECFKFMEEMKIQKENRKKYKLINNGKEIIENFTIHMIPDLNGYEDPYINLQSKLIKSIKDLDMVNENLIESYVIWEEVKNETPKIKIYNTYYYTKLNKLNEYIIYDLKIVADEMISIICVMKGKMRDDKIIISSIGEYINYQKKCENSNQYDFDEFNEFIDLFEKLNNVFNANKHSYSKADILVIGANENCFSTTYTKMNDFSKNTIHFVISSEYIVDEFNKFYLAVLDVIGKLTKK
ncbi:MAG: hypothetical protein RR623_03495 [Bacilli bacterium]